jgi:hypothetical protein
MTREEYLKELKNRSVDVDTIEKLRISKYKSVVQYDLSGNIIQIYDSAKNIAINVFNDFSNNYKYSRIYRILLNKKLKLYNNSYWIYEERLLELFNEIPIKLDIESSFFKTIKFKKRNNRINSTLYTIMQFDNNNNFEKIHDNYYVLINELNIPLSTLKTNLRKNKQLNELTPIRKINKCFIYDIKKTQIIPSYLNNNEFKVIPNFPNYLINKAGIIKNINTNKILRPQFKNKCLTVKITNNQGKRRHIYIKKLKNTCF